MSNHLSTHHLTFFPPAANDPIERLWNMKFLLSSYDKADKNSFIKLNLERDRICNDTLTSLQNFIINELQPSQSEKILNNSSLVIFEHQIQELVKNAYDAGANQLSFSLYANLDSLSEIIIRAEDNGELFLDADKHVVDDASYSKIRKNLISPKLHNDQYIFGGHNQGLKNISIGLEHFSGSLVVNCPVVPTEFKQGCTLDLLGPYQPEITALDIKRFMRKQFSKATVKEGTFSFHKSTYSDGPEKETIVISVETLRASSEARLLRNKEKAKSGIQKPRMG